MNVIIDTNVLISAALFKNSIPDLALSKALLNGKILVSQQTLQELINTLLKPKLAKYISTKDSFAFVKRIENTALWVDVDENITVCRDPKDNRYLELAISGKARFIITGDKDLLILHPFRNISILSPSNFLEFRL
jgi:putative PIN family toxin of toxin-antitoxin system